MAIGLAFVDIVGDTQRTGPQIERDMNRVLAVVDDAIDPVQIRSAVEAGTEADLTREINQDLRAVSAAIQAVQVNAELAPDTRAVLERNLQQTARSLRAARSQIEVRVDNRAVVEETIAAAEEAQAAAPAITIETNVDRDKLGKFFSSLGSGASSALGPIGGVSKALGGLTAVAQGLPTIVSLVTALAPAAALAAPALATVGLAVGTIKLATAGLSDAVAAAFDPSDPQAYADALKKLSPEAQKFVGVLHTMQPALKSLQQQVQNTVFKGLSTDLKELAGSALPTLRANLLQAAGTFNTIGHSVIQTGTALSDSGILGQALGSANVGLSNLAGIPAQIVAGLGQLAAAAGPSFAKLTAAGGGAFSKLSTSLNSAFESGGLQKAIEQAISLIGQLAHVVVNVAKIFGDVFAQSNASGANFVQTLVKITDTLVGAFANPAVQQGLKALFDTVSMLATTAMPLLAQAIGVVAPVLVALAPGVQALVQALGAALSPILLALGPLLQTAAAAISNLVVAAAPLLQVVSVIASAILNALTPVLAGLSTIFVQLQPVIMALSNALIGFLAPILGQLPALITPFVSIVTNLTGALLPVLTALITQLPLAELGQSFAQVAAALAPLIAQLAVLLGDQLKIMVPILIPIIGFVGQLAKIFVDNFAQAIQQIVLPALRALTALLRGDASSAFSYLGQAAEGVVKLIVREFIDMPGQILRALGNLDIALFEIGNQIILSLINGIKNKLGALGSVLGSVTQFIKDHKGPISLDRQLLTPAGQAIMGSLMAGLASQVPALQAQLGGITSMIGGVQPQMTGVSVGSGPSGLAASRSAGFASAVPAASVGGGGAPVVQVFLGTREIEDIVDTRVVASNAITSRRVNTGVRR